MMTYNYQHIEDLLLQLLNLLRTVFVDSENSEVQEFIDAGEYGLALETLVDIVNEEDKKISSEAMNIVFEVAKIMQLNKRVFENKLRGHVINN